MERIILSIVIIFIGIFLFSFNMRDLYQLIDKQSASKDEYVVVSYQYPINCIKCFIESDEILNYLNNNKPNKFNIIGLIVCDRDVELKSFIKSSNWKYPAYRIKNNDLKNLKVTNRTMLQIFNYKKELILELNYEDKTTKQKLNDFLKNI